MTAPERRWIAAVLLLVSLCLPTPSLGSHWSRTYGTGQQEHATSVLETPDCGFIVAGVRGEDASETCDAVLLKIGPLGELEWQKAYGTPDYDGTSSIAPCPDGGFLLGGSTTSLGRGYPWVVKVDRDGALQWQKAFEVPLAPGQITLVPGPGGGGYLSCTSGTFLPARAPWVVKFDPLGEILWQRAYGGGTTERTARSAPTSDGGLVVLATTFSFGDVGEGDLWVLKLDPSGNIEWQKVYGGEGQDFADETGGAVIQLRDGGYLVGGSTTSFGAHWAGELWVLRLDHRGNVHWEKRFEGVEGGEHVWVLAETPEQGFLVAALRVPSSVGTPDPWILKLDSQGDLLWQRVYGTDWHEHVGDLRMLRGGGFVLAASAPHFGAGLSEAWILKMNDQGLLDTGTCSFIQRFVPLPGIADTNATVADTSATVLDTTVAARTTSAISWNLDLTVEEQCADFTCTPLHCDDILVSPDPSCEGTELTLTTSPLCGEGPVSVEWDLDGDTVPDATGNPLSTTLPGGTRTVTATATDSCPDPGPQTCSLETTVTVLPSTPPGEVSGRREPPLLVGPTASLLTVEKDPDASAYNVYADSLGSWYAPTGARGSVCAIRSWTDNGDGTITLGYTLPRDSWIVVTASTPCAEGLAGCGTAGVERTTLGSWQLCGPAR